MKGSVSKSLQSLEWIPTLCFPSWEMFEETSGGSPFRDVEKRLRPE